MVNEDILKEATMRLVSRFHPGRIVLFGSQAPHTADAFIANPHHNQTFLFSRRRSTRGRHRSAGSILLGLWNGSGDGEICVQLRV